MATAVHFLKKSKQRMYVKEYTHPHTVPRLNLHVASNSRTANNVLDDILLNLQNETTPFHSTCPIPIGPPVNVDDSIVRGVDPVSELVKDKKQFRATLDQVKKSKAIKGLKLEDIEHLSKMAENEPGVIIHPDIVTLAQICSLDPDPFFSCDYNYYYGGNSAVTELQGRMTVVHIEQDNPSKLRVVVPEFKEETNFDVRHVNHSMKEGPIYQVDCSTDMVLLRQKKSCGLFKFKSDEEECLQRIAVVTTPEVFVSSTFNPFKPDEFATVSPNSAIEIHDIHSKSKRSVEIEGIKDNWGHVHYHDQNVLMFADRDSVCLCDLRDSGAESLQWEVKDKTEVCDEVFAAAKGKYLHYVCTKHFLLSLDVREGFHQRWSHGLSNAPSLLNVVPNETHHDALLLGCQCSGGIAYVRNSHFGDFTSDIFLPPVRLPSPRETLHRARIKGCLLSPIISSRFSLSLTGLTSFNHTGNVQVFSCNSVGDLFAQSIGPSSQCDTSIEPLSVDLERLHHWESQCLEHYSNMKHDITATRFSSLEHIAEVLERTPEAREDETSSSQPVTSSFQPWNMSKKHLMRFRDVLAPKLLAAWNIDEDDEWCDVEDETMADEASRNDESSDEEEDANARVLKWLEKYDQ